LAFTHAEFQRWVLDHGPALYRMAFRLLGDRHEAEDVVQEVFRSAWKSRSLFDQSRGERAWLATILRRRVVDHWRRTPVVNVTPVEHPPEVSIAGFDPTEQEYTDEMQQALSRLPNELKETLLLVVVAELTHQETADLLEIPLGTVLSRVSRARTRLREALLAIAEKQ
jgi:RNA polymerase sigma-70 factor, ECF subfamily